MISVLSSSDEGKLVRSMMSIAGAGRGAVGEGLDMLVVGIRGGGGGSGGGGGGMFVGCGLER